MVFDLFRGVAHAHETVLSAINRIIVSNYRCTGYLTKFLQKVLPLLKNMHVLTEEVTFNVIWFNSFPMVNQDGDRR